MSEKVTNEELVLRIRRGEKDLIGVLWDRVKQYAHVKACDMKAGDMVEDLEQECFLALVDAIKNYDEKAGAAFLTYAAFHFRARMWRYMHHETGARRIPQYMIERMRKYRKFVADFRRELGRDPSDLEIMSGCKWSRKVLGRIQESLDADRTASLDAPLDDGDGLTLADTVPGGADPAEEVEDRIVREQLSRELWGAVDRLPEQQSYVIRGYYQEEKSFREIEDDLGLPEGNARQISANGLHVLRSPGNKARFRPYMISLFGESVRGGLQFFLSSGTSSTERAALKDMGAWWEEDLQAR